jgi:hypothetical protein
MRIPLQKFESARHGLLEEADEAANHRYRHIDDPRSTNFGPYLKAFPDDRGIFKGRHCEYPLRTADAGQFGNLCEDGQIRSQTLPFFVKHFPIVRSVLLDGKQP